MRSMQRLVVVLMMFWNCSVRAFNCYSSSDYKRALFIWGDALKHIEEGKLSISNDDRARLHYNRARALCHLKQRTEGLEELDVALKLSPKYVNALVLQAESHFELYNFDACLASLANLESAGVLQNDRLDSMRKMAHAQKHRSHYDILGVERKATEAEVRKAFRRQSIKWHPDKHQNTSDSKARAGAMFRRVNEANQVLGDQYAKMMYDAEMDVSNAMRRASSGQASERSSADQRSRPERTSSGIHSRRSAGTRTDRPPRSGEGARRDREDVKYAQRYFDSAKYMDASEMGPRDDEDEDVIISDADDDMWPGNRDRSMADFLSSAEFEEELFHDESEHARFTRADW